MEVREGTLDQYVVDEQGQYKALNIIPGDVVLDLGGNIGAFAVYACNLGATRVVSFEPDQDNFRLLCANTAELPVSCLQVAVVEEGGPDTIDFFLNGGKNKGAHSRHVQRGREKVTVQAMPFSRARHLADPFILTKIKCDIEGGEYDIDWSLIPDGVGRIAMEIHLNKKEWRTRKAPLLVEQFAALGWFPLVAPKIGPSNWYTLAVWARR